MPHIIIECSENVAQIVSLDDVVRRLHETALATGVFPLGGLRTRVHVARHYRIADGDPRHAFMHVQLRIGRGRDVETRKRVSEQMFAASTPISRAGRPPAGRLNERVKEASSCPSRSPGRSLRRIFLPI